VTKVALIIAGYLISKFPFVVEEKPEATKVALEVPKINFSEAYDLPEGTIVVGELIKIEGVGLSEKDKAILKDIEGVRVEFILERLHLGNYDRLLLSKKSWPLFRDYSILPDMMYRIILKLIEAKVNDKTIPLFPKRDVFVGL
jgi:hypothetical protein